MRGIALLWDPLDRVQSAGLRRVPSIPRLWLRRLLWVAALVGALGLAGSESPATGRELAGRALMLARELASVATELFTAASANACDPDTPILAASGLADERTGRAELRLIQPNCDD